MSGLPPIPAAPERKQPRLLLGRPVPNRKSGGVRKAPGPARSGWNSRSRPRTPIQPPPGPGSSAPPAPECTYASYTNPQHRQRVFWAGSSNSSTLPTRSVRNGPPNPTERESLGGVPHCRRFRPLSRQEPWRPFGQRYGRRRHAYPSPSRRTASMLDPNPHRRPRRPHSHPRRRQRTRRQCHGRRWRSLGRRRSRSRNSRGGSFSGRRPGPAARGT